MAIIRLFLYASAPEQCGTCLRYCRFYGNTDIRRVQYWLQYRETRKRAKYEFDKSFFNLWNYSCVGKTVLANANIDGFFEHDNTH